MPWRYRAVIGRQRESARPAHSRGSSPNGSPAPPNADVALSNPRITALRPLAIRECGAQGSQALKRRNVTLNMICPRFLAKVRALQHPEPSISDYYRCFLGKSSSLRR